MHNGLVGLVLEVAIPSGSEFLAGPAIHHLELFFCWPELDARLDTIGCQRTGAVDIPLIEDSLLDGGITSHKVVKRFGFWLSPEYREGKVMILLRH